MLLATVRAARLLGTTARLFRATARLLGAALASLEARLERLLERAGRQNRLLTALHLTATLATARNGSLNGNLLTTVHARLQAVATARARARTATAALLLAATARILVLDLARGALLTTLNSDILDRSVRHLFSSMTNCSGTTKPAGSK